LVRRLGTFDIALIVIGSVIGSGIFRTPAVVAHRAPDTALIITAWVAGGAIALFGAFVLGELGARRPDDCGMYAYLRDAFHPIVGFAFGWSGLLASYSGGVAAAAILFAGYFISLTRVTIAPALVAAAALAILAALNALGVRQGTSFQNGLTILKLGAVSAIIVAGFVAPPSVSPQPQVAPPASSAFGLLSVALVPVLFAYAGATVANFMAAETKDAARVLPLGLTIGMIVVAFVYVLVNVACIRVLGVAGLAKTDVPATAVLSDVVGRTGTQLAAIAIAVTTLGYMSNRLLTLPRLYHAMAADGLFFRAVAWIDPRTKVPTIAVFLTALVAMAIALSAGYGHILNYVIAVISAFNGLLGVALFVIRARDGAPGLPDYGGFRVPLHPFSTVAFIAASWGVAIATCVAYPVDGLMGLAIVLSAVPIYLLWKRGRFPQGRPA
jgi:APA family basic amino acid/polyamine antiporter